MLSRCVTLFAVFAVFSAAAGAKNEVAGEFDYYIAALSWSPGWCARQGDARGAGQCEQSHGWILHGLWPQYENGWPSYCRTGKPDPAAAQVEAMADIMGSARLAKHEWKKHGRCSGLSAAGYFAASRRTYRRIKRPAVFRRHSAAVTLSAKAVERAFLAANPGLRAGMITITCKDGHIQEARICLTKNLRPRNCAPSAARDCAAKDAILEAVR